VVYTTRGLIDALCGFAREAEPSRVSIALATTPAGDLDTHLPPETPVFTDFYFPDAGRSVGAVFGVDLGTPAGQTQGRFVSHPRGDLELTQRDDFHAVVFVAVPPWEPDSVAAFSRDGRRHALDVLDVEPPVESLG
jgi:hypothetical protein